VISQPTLAVSDTPPRPVGSAGRTRLGIEPPTAVILVGGVVAVVTQAKEPDEPEHEQADVEDPEADHEDPPFRAHRGGW